MFEVCGSGIHILWIRQEVAGDGESGYFPVSWDDNEMMQMHKAVYREKVTESARDALKFIRKVPGGCPARGTFG